MLGHRAFHSFYFSVHIVNRLRSPYLSVRVIVFLFSRAWGIFENFFFLAGQTHSFAGLPEAVRFLAVNFHTDKNERPANVCDCEGLAIFMVLFIVLLMNTFMRVMFATMK